MRKEARMPLSLTVLADSITLIDQCFLGEPGVMRWYPNSATTKW